MKKYFQKVYNETGQKPFTFLNCALCVLIPIAVFVILGSNASSSEGLKVIIPSIIVFILCLAINVGLLFMRFKNISKAFFLTLLNFLASIAFFCKLILFPLIKLCFKLSLAFTSVQMGNTQTASAQLSGSQGVKTSAFNWFKYDGTIIQDIAGTEGASEEEIAAATAADQKFNYGYSNTLGRAFTERENINAHNLGYANAEAAEADRKLDKIKEY